MLVVVRKSLNHHFLSVYDVDALDGLPHTATLQIIDGYMRSIESRETDASFDVFHEECTVCSNFCQYFSIGSGLPNKAVLVHIIEWGQCSVGVE